MAKRNYKNRTLFHGDNLDFMRSMNSETVDLIATDPPFNKSRDFHATPDSLASGASFQDRWSWTNDVHETWTDQLENEHESLYYAIENARTLHSDSMGAFLCFMAVRLLAMHRLLKPTGSIYLHCDPTASHYLKTVMDAIFGRRNFLNEIVWCYTSGGVSRKYFGKKHDLILFYVKSHKQYRFNTQYRPYSEGTVQRGLTQYKKNINEKYELNKKGAVQNDWWTDIQPILSPTAKEQTGYPTQKPLALYERIIKASSNKGDMVLDPFAGCATTCVAAEKHERQWVGIDIWDGAEDVVVDRLEQEGLKAPKYTHKTKKARQQYLFASELTFTSKLPERTDDEEVAVATLPTLKRALLAPWQRMSNTQIRAELEEAQMDDEEWIICAGCGRQLEGPFMELDHITPRSSRGIDDISNRILLCSPCNGRKSNNLTLDGLRRENKKKEIDWMMDEEAAKAAEIGAHNRYVEVTMRD